MLNSSVVKELNKILPPNNVLLQKEECYAYSFDASTITDTKTADAVVFVESIEQVKEVVKFANKKHIPIICRGAGTNTVGGDANWYSHYGE